MELRFNSLKLALFFCAVIFFRIGTCSYNIGVPLCIKVYNIHTIQLHIILKKCFLKILKDLLICIFFLQYLTVLILHFMRLILHLYKVTIIRIMPHPRQTKLSLGPFRETIMDPSTHVNKCMFENIYLEEQVPHFLQTIVLFPNL